MMARSALVIYAAESIPTALPLSPPKSAGTQCPLARLLNVCKVEADVTAVSVTSSREKGTAICREWRFRWL